MFRDRKDAGLQLAKNLEVFRNENPIVLGIARGGVETGYYVAKELDCEFSVLIARKLGFPTRPEAAFGAVAEDGSQYLNLRVKNLLSKDQIDQVIQEETAEIKRRIQAYRGGQPLQNLKDRTVILVDDGIATGATLYAAIELCRNQRVKKLIVAAPVSSIDTEQKLQSMVDEVIILETPSNYYAVSQAYENFQNMTDQDVVNFLKSVKTKTTAKKTKSLS